MEQTEFVNIYIEKLLKEVQELIKYKLLIEAKLDFIDSANAKLVKKVEELQAQLDKQNKKSNKPKEPEVSSEVF